MREVWIILKLAFADALRGIVVSWLLLAYTKVSNDSTILLDQCTVESESSHTALKLDGHPSICD